MPAFVKVAGAVVLVAYAALVASVRSFTWPALVLTAVAGVVVLVLATRRQAERSPATGPRRGIVLWAVLAAAVVAWELLAYFQSPRDDHPTISSMVDALEAHRPLRAVLFIGWVVLGRELARR
jgi:xanthine/uracil/vitamin C permease (AzgA family)